jgi:flavin prenyltransferase
MTGLRERQVFCLFLGAGFNWCGSANCQFLTSPKRGTYTRCSTYPMAKTQAMSVTVGITGASGAVYAQALLRMLDRDTRVDHVYLVASDAGLRLVASELGLVASEPKKLGGMITGTAAAKIETLPNKDIGASIASGSAPVDAMVVIPCSAGAVGAIAAGTAADLLTRSADVCLKERRPLVLCLRETPLNRIHLENLLRVNDAGAVVMPAMPAFYYEPKTIQDLVEQYACRVLAQIGLPQEKQYVWKGGATGTSDSGKKKG